MEQCAPGEVYLSFIALTLNHEVVKLWGKYRGEREGGGGGGGEGGGPNLWTVPKV